MDASDATKLVNVSGERLQRTVERLHLRRRSRILGVPIGPKRTDWAKVGLLGAGAAAVTAGTAGAVMVVKPSVRNPDSGDGGELQGADDVEEKLGQLSDDERALVRALKEVEARTDRAVTSIRTLEREGEDPERAGGWVLTVGLRRSGASTNSVTNYRVVTDAEGSLRDCKALDDAGGE